MTTEPPSNPTPAVVADPWSEPNFRAICKLWEVSPADEQKLRIHQAKLKDIDHDWKSPDVLLAYASTGGWETTEQRFRKMIQWRLDNDVDSLLTGYKPNPLILDNSPVAFLKDYDRDGDPIYLERGGAVDTRGLLNRFSWDDLMRHAIWLREVQCGGEWIYEYERRQGRGIHNITLVYDLEGLSTSHLHPNVLSFFQTLMQLTEAYYPGPIKRMIIIRAPTIFRFAWQTIRHFFSEESQKAMIFAGADYLEELSKWMDIDVLPPCINPTGKGETAVGMPKNMDCGIIPAHIGKGGIGYRSPSSGGLSQPGVAKSPSGSTDSLSLSSTEDDDSASSDGEDASAALGALRVA